MNPFSLPDPDLMKVLVGLLWTLIVAVWTLLLVELIWFLVLMAYTLRRNRHAPHRLSGRSVPGEGVEHELWLMKISPPLVKAATTPLDQSLTESRRALHYAAASSNVSNSSGNDTTVRWRTLCGAPGAAARARIGRWI